MEQKEATKYRGDPKGFAFLFQMWHSLYYSFYKPGDKSGMRKGPNCDCNNRKISVVICDTYTP
jgi:hypothetical protein